MKLWLAAVAVALLHASASAAPSAEDLYHQGQTAYDHSDYTTAIARWRASYELSSANGLLFNIAQAYRLGGDCKQALSTYRHFISIDPTADQHQLAYDFVRELEPRCGTPTAAPIVDHPVERRGRTLKVEGLATAGAGAVLIAIGLGLGDHASALGDDVTRACSVSCDWAAQKSTDAAGRHDATLGYAFDALGLAAIAGGAIMYYLGNRESAVTVAPVSASARPSGAIAAVVSWSGSW